MIMQCKCYGSYTRALLGQNCVRLSDTTADDVFFFKNLFCQKQCKNAMNIKVVQIRCALL